jgi:SAM-dependent methyltransferase
MPEHPHHYALRSAWVGDPGTFEGLVLYIREHGRERAWGSRTYSYLDLNGRSYWTMGSPLAATILINAAETPYDPTPYDALAPRYDALFSSPEAEREEIEVLRLALPSGRVLDIGCGTGMLLRHLRVAPEQYVGIDPSLPMLERARASHPGHARAIFRCPMEDFHDRRPFDTIVALFGVASYLHLEPLHRIPSLLAPGGRAFLMFYDEDYWPSTHREMEGRPGPGTRVLDREGGDREIGLLLGKYRVWTFERPLEALP